MQNGRKCKNLHNITYNSHASDNILLGKIQTCYNNQAYLHGYWL